MPDKDELLKELLKNIDIEDLQKLAEQKTRKEDKGPRKSVLKGSSTVFDNSEFEAIKDMLDVRIPQDEREAKQRNPDGERSKVPTRAPIEKIDTQCHRCGKQDSVLASQINSVVDDKIVYLCPHCSTKIRT